MLTCVDLRLFLKSGEPDSGRTLRYDPESKQYEFSDEAMDVPPCSICLEELGKAI